MKEILPQEQKIQIITRIFQRLLEKQWARSFNQVAKTS